MSIYPTSFACSTVCVCVYIFSRIPNFEFKQFTKNLLRHTQGADNFELNFHDEINDTSNANFQLPKQANEQASKLVIIERWKSVCACKFLYPFSYFIYCLQLSFTISVSFVAAFTSCSSHSITPLNDFFWLKNLAIVLRFTCLKLNSVFFGLFRLRLKNDNLIKRSFPLMLRTLCIWYGY